MSNILQELESRIEGIQTATAAKANVGIVREIGDGVAKIEGLSAAMLNEMLEFPGGIYGLALNLEETEVGAIVLGDYTEVTTRRLARAMKSRPRGGSCKLPSAKVCLDAWSMLSVNLSTGKARLSPRSFIRLRTSPLVSSNAKVSANRCKPASWQLMR